MLLYKTPNRKGAARWRGPAKILGIYETGVTAKSQSQYLYLARYCIRKKAEEKDATKANWNIAKDTRDLWGGPPTKDLGTDLKLTGAPREEGGNTEEPGEGLDIVLLQLKTWKPSLAPRRVVPAPDSPNLSIQLPPSPSLSGQLRLLFPAPTGIALPLKPW